MYGPEQINELQRATGAREASAGNRIFGNRTLADWLQQGPIGSTVQAFIGERAEPVRAILFDKTETSNWALGWHQDRTIAVRARVERPGFDHWTIKSGQPHVEPPFSIIENMLTARIHIDEVSPDNGPLLIVPGSHRLGRITEDEIQSAIDRYGAVACLAALGDVWLYRTSILHASERSRTASRRRVLQVDFSAGDLPPGMEWLGIG